MGITWPRVCLFAFALAAWACGSESGARDAPPLALEPSWPETDEPLPVCTPSEIAIAPRTQARGGAVQFEFASPLVATGVLQRVRVTVRDGAGQIDMRARGALAIAPLAGVEIVEAPSIEGGVGSLALRLTTPGRVRLEGSLEGDGQSGFVELDAYASQLPVWELTIDPDQFRAMIDNADERIEVKARLAIDGKPYDSEVRIHGGSSRSYPKKSFRIKLARDVPEAFGRSAVLRSEYNDKTLLRYWLNLRLFRTLTWVPTPRSELVHFRINGEYYGLMHHLERIDAQFPVRHGYTIGGSLYEPDPPRELAAPGGDLTPFAELDRYREVYQQHSGTRDYADLIALVERTLVLPEPAFRRVIEGEVDVDEVLVYLAMQAIVQNQDQVRKNYYLYREYTPSDSRWLVFPWDLDLTWGHLWTEEGDVLDERIFTDRDLFYGERGASAPSNELTHRLLGVPRYRARFVQFVRHLAPRVLALDGLEQALGNALCRAAPDIVADVKKRASNEEYLMRVEELAAFARARAAFIRDQIGE